MTPHDATAFRRDAKKHGREQNRPVSLPCRNAVPHVWHGTTARTWCSTSVRILCPHVREQHRVGFVFGREDAGLPNQVVDRCDAVVTLEAVEEHYSYNLAQAVLLVLHRAMLRWPHREGAVLRAALRAAPVVPIFCASSFWETQPFARR